MRLLASLLFLLASHTDLDQRRYLHLGIETLYRTKLKVSWQAISVPTRKMNLLPDLFKRLEKPGQLLRSREDEI